MSCAPKNLFDACPLWEGEGLFLLRVLTSARVAVMRPAVPL